MITSETLNVLSRRVPCYHTLSPRFVKGGFSICPCAACKNVLKENGHLVCGRVADDLEDLGCRGNAIVNSFGTCDAARFCTENYDNFRLEQEVARLPSREGAENDPSGTPSGSVAQSAEEPVAASSSPVLAPSSAEGDIVEVAQ